MNLGRDYTKLLLRLVLLFQTVLLSFHMMHHSWDSILSTYLPTTGAITECSKASDYGNVSKQVRLTEMF